MPYVYPSEDDRDTCVIVLIPSNIVPIVGALFSQLEKRNRWVSDEDWKQGYHAFTALQDQLMNNCLKDLIQEIRDFRGIKPAYASTPVEDRTSDMYNSLNDINQAFLDMRGIMVDGWLEDQYASLNDIVQAVRGTNQTSGMNIWQTISDLLSAGSSLASIIDFITDLLTSQEEVVVEGGLLIALCALTAANSGLLQQAVLSQTTQANNIAQILTALRGDTQPTDNILEALRGDTDASDTRNVVDLLT